MANVFNSVPGLHPKRNGFSAHTYRNDFTSSLGINIPVYIQEVVPGTRVHVSTSALVRLQALIAPIMDNIDFYVHFWKIPYRLLEHDRFTQFISGEIDASDYDALFCTPYHLAEEIFITAEVEDYSEIEALAWWDKVFGNGSLFDFCGYDKSLFPSISYNSDSGKMELGTDGNNWKTFNWRRLIAYHMVHLNWYMNENVPYFEKYQEDVEKLIKEQSLNALVELIILQMGEFDTTFLPHGWEADYFTKALPNVQFGSPVSLPLAGSAPVIVDTSRVMFRNYGDQEGPIFNFDGTLIDPSAVTVQPLEDPLTDGTLLANSNNLQSIEGKLLHYNERLSQYMPNLGGEADLSEASAITINELRFANALQLFKERQMRFGRRRQEYYKGFFDVEPEDLRLQLPKYLGGGRIPINITDIEQTSANEGGQVLGHLAGKATSVAGGFAGFDTFCSEETIIIGIAFAMPHITYAQSVSRFLFKTNDFYDYFNPSFEHLGEQAVEKLELYAGAPDAEFGYTPRYNEYRFHSNEMHGAFKDTLAYWTLGRIFDSPPSLNADFIYMQPSVFNRIFAVEDSNPMLCSMLFRQRIIQPVSKYGVPMLIA